MSSVTLTPPSPLSRHDRAVYAAIEAGDDAAFQQHFPHMCVSEAHMGHALALGIQHDSPFVLAELRKGDKASSLGSRLHPTFKGAPIRAAANLALIHQRDSWLLPLFNTLGGPMQGMAVTTMLTQLVKDQREADVHRLLAQPLTMAEGLSVTDPLSAAIATHHLPLVKTLWERLRLPGRFPHFLSPMVVEALADGVPPDVRGFVLARSCDDGLLQATLVNAARKDRAEGLQDWWREVQRRRLVIHPSDANFALIEAADQGAERSVAFLLHTLSPKADPRAEKGRALQVAAAAHHMAIVRQLVPRVDLLDVSKHMMRRKRLPSGDGLPLTTADNLAHIALIAECASDAQQASLEDHFGKRLGLTLARQRQARTAPPPDTEPRRRRLRS